MKWVWAPSRLFASYQQVSLTAVRVRHMKISINSLATAIYALDHTPGGTVSSLWVGNRNKSSSRRQLLCANWYCNTRQLLRFSGSLLAITPCHHLLVFYFVQIFFTFLRFGRTVSTSWSNVRIHWIAYRFDRIVFDEIIQNGDDRYFGRQNY